MYLSRRAGLIFAALIPALLLAGCGRDPVLRVNEAVVKLSPVDSNPSAMYFTLYGGPTDVRLIAVTSRSAIRTEMHESDVDPKSGMVTMTKIEKLDVPRGGKIEFRRGGKHLMLSGINLPARRLERIDVEFVFSNGDRILVETPIEKIVDEAGDHGSH